MKARFTKVAADLKRHEAKIVEELIEVQGVPADLGGYFMPNDAKTEKVMRPSTTLNAIIDSM